MTDSRSRPNRIIRPGEVAGRLGVSLTTLWRMRCRGEFPEPIRVSAGAVGWRLSTLDRWFDDREAEARR